MNKVVIELRIANLLAYHARLDSKSAEARATLRAVRMLLQDNPL